MCNRWWLRWKPDATSQVDWRVELQVKCGLDPDDIHFFMKRLERTGFVSELTGTFVGYTGGQFMITPSLKRFNSYLAQHPDYTELGLNFSQSDGLA